MPLRNSREQTFCGLAVSYTSVQRTHFLWASCKNVYAVSFILLRLEVLGDSWFEGKKCVCVAHSNNLE